MLYLGLSDALPLASEVTAAAAPKVDLPEVEPVAFQPPPLRAFNEIAARPLFASDRRPYVAPAPEADPETEVVEVSVEPPPVELVGIMLTDAQRSALFAFQSENRLVWIYEGQAIEGWRVDEIEPASARLTLGDREAVLELRAD